MFSSKKYIKNFVKAISIIAGLGAVLITTFHFRDNGFDYQKDLFVMDTAVSIKSEGDVIKNISYILHEYDTLLSRESAPDGVYILNINTCLSSAELSGVISDVFSLNEKYGTLTDITIGRCTALWGITSDNPQIPSDEDIGIVRGSIGTRNVRLSGDRIFLENGCQLDFGAVGKGIALDKCHEYLKENSSDRTFISTGSSMLFYNMEMENVSITDPDGGILAEVCSDYSFLSTSGGYERFFEAGGKTYCHIIDPRTGRPTETDLTTVTVFCESGLMSDFLSTAIFIDGSENIGKYLQSDEYKIFAADKNKKLYVSDGLEYEVLNDAYTK